jgi:hypothetical protein
MFAKIFPRPPLELSRAFWYGEPISTLRHLKFYVHNMFIENNVVQMIWLWTAVKAPIIQDPATACKFVADKPQSQSSSLKLGDIKNLGEQGIVSLMYNCHIAKSSSHAVRPIPVSQAIDENKPASIGHPGFLQ